MVLRNPRHCKLIEIRGNKTDVCKKSPRAGRSSALNCRIYFDISMMDSEQADIDQPSEEFRKILTKLLRRDVEFSQQLRVSTLDAGAAVTTCHIRVPISSSP